MKKILILCILNILTFLPDSIFATGTGEVYKISVGHGFAITSDGSREHILYKGVAIDGTKRWGDNQLKDLYDDSREYDFSMVRWFGNSWYGIVYIYGSGLGYTLYHTKTKRFGEVIGGGGSQIKIGIGGVYVLFEKGFDGYQDLTLLRNDGTIRRIIVVDDGYRTGIFDPPSNGKDVFYITSFELLKNKKILLHLIKNPTYNKKKETYEGEKSTKVIPVNY